MVPDVTEFVSDWFNGTYPDYGFFLTQTDIVYGSYYFYTKEYVDNGYPLVLSFDYDYISTESASLG